MLRRLIEDEGVPKTSGYSCLSALAPLVACKHQMQAAVAIIDLDQGRAVAVSNMCLDALRVIVPRFFKGRNRANLNILAAAAALALTPRRELKLEWDLHHVRTNSTVPAAPETAEPAGQRAPLLE